MTDRLQTRRRRPFVLGAVVTGQVAASRHRHWKARARGRIIAWTARCETWGRRVDGVGEAVHGAATAAAVGGRRLRGWMERLYAPRAPARRSTARHCNCCSCSSLHLCKAAWGRLSASLSTAFARRVLETETFADFPAFAAGPPPTTGHTGHRPPSALHPHPHLHFSGTRKGALR